VDFSVAKYVSSDSKQKLGTAELLFRCADEIGLQPSWLTPDGLFVITVGGQEKYINFARSPLNSHTAASLAKDKYLARLILERHNMPNIPFTRPATYDEAESFFHKYKKIVAKPVRGAGAHDIHIVTSHAQLKALRITDYILEQYIAGKELRYLILEGNVIGVHHSEYGVSVEEDRPLQRISYPQFAWDTELVECSLEIGRILDLRFAAVDYLVDASGRAYVLEVNSTPGLKWFHAPTSGPVVDVARHFLEAITKTKPELVLESVAITAQAAA